MQAFFLLASIGGDLARSAQETGQAFGFTPRLFFAQVASFCLVAFLLQRFAYRPILQVLEERRQRIAEGLANADKIKAELARTEAARREILAQTNTQANQLIAEAQAAAARVQEVEIKKALAAAEHILAKAREAAALDHARMLAELKQEIGRLVVETTAKVSGKVLTPQDQQRLAEETRQQLAA